MAVQYSTAHLKRRPPVTVVGLLICYLGYEVLPLLQAPMHTRSLATLKQQIVRSALKKSAPATSAANA
jgi:xanthosine utilization system XapX-like protein